MTPLKSNAAVAALRTFRNLTAGSTAIMSDGKVIKFGGRIQKVEGGTVVGHGTYTTNIPEEIEFLLGLTKMASPQVWEEIPDAVEEVPAAVVVTAEKKVVEADLADKAVVSTNPAVTALLAKAQANGMPGATSS